MSSFKTFESKAGHLMGNFMQKGSELVETGKIRLSIGREERAVDELFYKIGEAVYENCKKNGVSPAYIAADCDEVDERRTHIALLNAKLNAARAASEDMGAEAMRKKAAREARDEKEKKEEKEVIIDITVEDKKGDPKNQE